MEKTSKEILVKDLCARLGTNLVCSIYRTDDEGVGYRDEILYGYCKGDIWYEFYFREDCSIGIDNVSKIKPYLFPLSSLTEEQRNTISQLLLDTQIEFPPYGELNTKGCDNLFVSSIKQANALINYCLANHLDINGLIEKGLAIDATGLNIY